LIVTPKNPNIANLKNINIEESPTGRKLTQLLSVKTKSDKQHIVTNN
jgi:hypothetical protein